MAEQNEETCPICYEVRDDLRMLPCWHVACLTCILGMTQTGSGRAVNCHICRKPCLFENIRSIPRPVRCASCNNFVKNPRKLPCCTNLYCLECLGRNSTFGVVVCKNMCKSKSYDVDALVKPSICISCFCMHADKPAPCGHTFCEKCRPQQSVSGRACPLCEALRTPIPAPINPIQPSLGAPASLGLQPNQRVVDQMELISALQTIGAWNQNNVARQQHRFQTAMFGASYSDEDSWRDLKRGCGFLVTMFFVGLLIGLDYKTWIIGGILMAVLKMAKFYNWFLCLLIAWVLWFLSLYYCFWEHVTLGLVNFFGKIALNYATAKFFPGITHKKRPILCFDVVMAIWTCLRFSSIFTHQLVLSLVREYLWNKMIPQNPP